MFFTFHTPFFIHIAHWCMLVTSPKTLEHVSANAHHLWSVNILMMSFGAYFSSWISLFSFDPPVVIVFPEHHKLCVYTLRSFLCFVSGLLKDKSGQLPITRFGTRMLSMNRQNLKNRLARTWKEKKNYLIRRLFLCSSVVTLSCKSLFTFLWELDVNMYGPMFTINFFWG